MIRKIIRDNAPYGFNADEREDAEQQTAMQIITHALPAFDQWRQPQVKVTTFIYRCAFRHASGIFRTFRRRQRSRPRSNDLQLADQIAPDQRYDRLVEQLAHAIHQHPERLGKYGRAILSQSEGTLNATVAATLGIATSTYASARSDARTLAVQILNHTNPEKSPDTPASSIGPHPYQIMRTMDADQTQAIPAKPTTHAA